MSVQHLRGHRKSLRSGLSYQEVFDPKDRHTTPVIVFGVEHASLQEACCQHGLADSYVTIHRWLKKGISPDEAFTKALNPSRHKKGQVVVFGVKYRSFKEACRLIPSAPSITTIRSDSKKGCP
jgi:hypothetical protein